MYQPSIEEVMIRIMALTIVQDVAELRGMNMPTDFETRNALVRSVIARIRAEAEKALAANVELTLRGEDDDRTK